MKPKWLVKRGAGRFWLCGFTDKARQLRLELSAAALDRRFLYFHFVLHE
jgi:hypothetical protein